MAFSYAIIASNAIDVSTSEPRYKLDSVFNGKSLCRRKDEVFSQILTHFYFFFRFASVRTYTLIKMGNVPSGKTTITANQIRTIEKQIRLE